MNQEWWPYTPYNEVHVKSVRLVTLVSNSQELQVDSTPETPTKKKTSGDPLTMTVE